MGIGTERAPDRSKSQPTHGFVSKAQEANTLKASSPALSYFKNVKKQTATRGTSERKNQQSNTMVVNGWTNKEQR